MANIRGIEISVNKIKNYNILFGAVDKDNPRSIYIELSAWGNPIIDDTINYKQVIRRLNKDIKSIIHSKGNGSIFNLNKTMVDLDMRDSGIKYGKSTFINCEITLYQLEVHQLKSETLLYELNSITNNIITSIFNENKYFKFYKSKVHAKNKLKRLNHKD